MGKIKQQTINSRIDFFYYAFRNILLAGLPLTIISGLVLSHLSIHSSATSSGTDNLTISIYTACTLSSTVNDEHNSVVDVGTYKTNIGKTTITTLCNDGNGYSIYANGFSNNEEGNNKLINSTYPQYSIDTGLATSGLTSQWAMKLNNIENDPSPTPPSIDSSYNDTYGLVPSTWTKVAYRQSGTTDMSEGSSFTTTYSVYASSSQYNGTYNGQVKYVLLHPYKNDSTITTVPTFEESFAISGKEKVAVNGINYYKMQDMNSYICERVSNTAETPTIQLVDIRDNKMYWIAKLADDNCWMTQNLDLDIDSTKTYTHYDTDLGWDSNAFNTNATWTPDTTNGKYNLPVNGTSVIGWSNQSRYPYSANPGDVYYYTSDSAANDIKYTSLSECVMLEHTEASCEHYHAGNYYNWTAATAMNDSNDMSNNGSNATTSICPAGWRLIMGSANEFGNLLYDYGIIGSTVGAGINYQADGFIKIRTTPLWFIRPGYISGGGLNKSSINGSYWSSTIDSGSNAYSQYFNDKVWTLNTDQKGLGVSVRCVAR